MGQTVYVAIHEWLIFMVNIMWVYIYHIWMLWEGVLSTWHILGDRLIPVAPLS